MAHGRRVGALTRRTLALVVMVAGCAGPLPYRPEYSVGTGVGVGLGEPRSAATTLAVFRPADAGAPPWRVRAKVVGVDAVDIVLDPTRPSGQ